MRSKYILLASMALALALAGCENEVKNAPRSPLNSISVEPETVTLTEGFTKQLTASTTPAGNEAILEWQSEDPTIATVSGDGLVTAVRGGSTVINVIARGVTASVSVTVNAVEDIVLTPATPLMEIGDELQLGAVTVPAVVEGIVLSYESSDEGVVTISSTGLMKAIAPGNATITVKGGRMTKDMTVKVNNPDVVEQSQWKKLDASSEEEGNPVANAIDGKYNNYWQSDAAGAMPQWFSVDMGARKNIDGFLFTNRQDQGQLAHPKKVIFEVSNDGTTWDKVLEVAEMPDLFAQQILPLSERKTARYFKITVESNWADAPYTYIADVCIYNGDAPAINPTHKKDWTVIEWSSVFADLYATRIIDNDINSPWHANVGDAQPWVVIDLKNPHTIKTIYFTGRQGGAGDTAASPKNIVFSVSDDNQTWETLLDIAELPNLRTTQTLDVPTPKTGRYLKIEIRSNWADQPYSYIGEIDISNP